MNGASVLSTFGWVLGILSALKVLAAVVAARYSEQGAVLAFAASSLVCGFVAISLIFGFRDRVVRLRRRHGLGLVALVWLGVPVFAAIPFAAIIAEEGIRAGYFEAVSAFTTTGSTLTLSLDTQPRSVVFWRALLQWTGGATTVVFAVASLDRARWETGEGLLIFSAGLADQSRLRAVIREVLPFYALLTAICFFALLLTGLPRFDAMCLALSALSTGGAMPRDGAFAIYGSLAAAYVVSVFMLIGAGFYIGFRVVTGRQTLTHEATIEAVIALLVVAVASVALTGLLLEVGGATVGADIARALFSVASLVSTTGFLYDTRAAFNIPLPAAFIFIMVGGIFASTAGGLKIGRVLHMLRDARRELDRLVHPSAVAKRIDRAGSAESGRVVWTYFVAYLIAFSLLALVTAWYGVDFEHALFWSAAMVSNAGPAMTYLPVAEISPLRLIAGGGNDVLLFASAAAMVLGRIEVLALLAILTPTFWRR